MTDAFREAAELEAGQRISAGGLPLRTLEPHPDTARADEAERMLREAIKLASSYAPGEPVAMCLIRDVHGLREWYDARSKRYSESLKQNALEAKIREQRAALAATEAELAALTEG